MTAKPGKVPILLIHGSGFNEIEWVASWPWLSKEEYGSVYTLNLEPDRFISDNPAKGIEELSLEVRKKIEEMGVKKVRLIGHSLGGLVAADFAENHADVAGVTVDTVITIATPWYGAPLLNCKKEENKSKRYKEMTENSEIVRTLVGKVLFSEQQKIRNYYSIGSTMDAMVPGSSSIVASKPERVRLFSWLGHYGVIAHPGTWLQIRSWLDPLYGVSII